VDYFLRELGPLCAWYAVVIPVEAGVGRQYLYARPDDEANQQKVNQVGHAYQ
jgi:hypothetical protein